MTNNPMPWIDDYKPRSWDVYKIEVGSKLPVTNAEDEICVHFSESPMAEICYTCRHDATHFYPDFELLMASDDLDYELNSRSAGELFKLTENWQYGGRAYPAGTLVLQSYEGVKESPMCFTYLVERQDT